MERHGGKEARRWKVLRWRGMEVERHVDREERRRRGTEVEAHGGREARR